MSEQMSDNFETVWNSNTLCFMTDVPALWTEREVDSVKQAYREALADAKARYALVTQIKFMRQYPALKIDDAQWEAFVATGQEITLANWNKWMDDHTPNRTVRGWMKD